MAKNKAAASLVKLRNIKYGKEWLTQNARKASHKRWDKPNKGEIIG